MALFPLEPVEVWYYNKQFYETNSLLYQVGKGFKNFDAKLAHLKLDLNQMREVLAVAQEVLDE